MANSRPTVIEMGWFERMLNRLYGLCVRAGIAFGYNYLLEVNGRKSGRVFRTPVNLLEMNGRSYLVASRGVTSWVKNARAAGGVALAKGAYRETFSVRELGDDEKAAVLKEFLTRYSTTVARFFPVPPDSPEEVFRRIADRYPTFELIPKSR